MSKEQQKPNLGTDLEKLKAIVDDSGQRPEIKDLLILDYELPENKGKVIPIHNKKLTPEQEEATTIELNKITKQISDIEAEKKILEEAWGEGLAKMDKRDKNYKELDKLLYEFNDELKNLVSRRRVLEIALLTPTEFNELDEVRAKLGKMSSKSSEDRKADMEKWFKGQKTITIEKATPEQTALVPQPKQEVEKHKDWGAWRRDEIFEDDVAKGFAIMTYPILGLPLDLGNWTYRKIKRLMGKGAELDGEKGKGEEKTRKIFRDFYGGGKLETTDEQEKYGYHVGQRLKLNKNFDFINKYNIDYIILLNAKSLKIVGFTNLDSILVQINNKKVLGYSINAVKDRFEPIPETSEEKEPKKFTTVSETMGERIIRERRKIGFHRLDRSYVVSTGEQEKYGLHVGDKVRVKNIASASALENSYEEVVGFTEDGQVITKVKGGAVATDSVEMFNKDFETISETSEEKDPKTFTSIGGDTIISTGERELFKTYVGEKFNLKVGAKYHLMNDRSSKGTFPNLTTLEIVEIVGFTKIKDVIVQLSGGKVMVLSPSSIPEFFNKIPETSDDYGTPIKR